VVVEIWCKNIILDRALGFQYIPLETLPFNQYDYPASYEQWFNIDAELVTINGEVQGTRDPTGHMILLDLHFELPFDVDQQQQHEKLNYQNYAKNEQYIENYSDYGGGGVGGNNHHHHHHHQQHQQQQHYVNNQHNHLQYGQLTTPTGMSSLETSRQNSYERDERQFYDCNNYYNSSFAHDEEDEEVYEDAEDGDGYDDGILSYNSRPMRLV
jgi:hypothetical protein